MPSPFPGTDPYLEAPELWLDFHNGLAAEIQAALNRTLAPSYRARLTSYLVEVPLRLYGVEVVTTAEQQLVTVIEILSPSNKRTGSDTFTEYARKRRDILRSQAHLMEIDLLRGGTRPPLQKPVPLAPYYVVLSRAERRPTVDVWPLQLATPLPRLPVPLLEPDADAPLELGAVVASVYERAAFEREIDYRQPPPPPSLSADEAAWVETLLAGFRDRGEAPNGHP